MIVYRVEHQFKIDIGGMRKGPYRNMSGSGCKLGQMEDEHSNDPEGHPTVSMDDCYKGGDYFSGFPGEDDYKKWFKGYRAELIRRGFVLGIYETDDWEMGMSYKQVVFKGGKRIGERRLV